MITNDFAVYILSHGRPDNIVTLKTLIDKGHYSGKWYIVIDNEDDTAEEYIRRFGKDRIVQFDKSEIAKTFDTADMEKDRRTIVYARNACFDIAEKQGIKYFLELDDDYFRIMMRYISEGKLKGSECNDLDKVFSAFIELLKTSCAYSVAMAQGGDFIGGKCSQSLKKDVLRKCMNSFFCATNKRFSFIGRINEDVNTYTTLASRGALFFTSTKVMLVQKQTQNNKGGMTDVYLDKGTFLKSFYTVMMMPSAVKIGTIGNCSKNKRIHHCVNWSHCVPCILREEYRKA